MGNCASLENLCPRHLLRRIDKTIKNRYPNTMEFVRRVVSALGSREFLFGADDNVSVSTKEGTLWRVDSSGKWVKRWFELREDVLASYKAEDRSKLKNAIKVSKITKVAMTPGDAAGTSFTMTCGTTDYPFRADEPADAEARVAVISKRMAADHEPVNITL